MQKIIPHLWFDREAKEAVSLYTALFDNSRLISSTTIHDTPSGDADILRFELAGTPMMAINGGPFFKFNPSASLMVTFQSEEKLDAVWQSLAEGGSALMELGAYPFSKRYGWIQDRYGLSWQLMLSDAGPSVVSIAPNLLFSGTSNGKAEDAIRWYTDIFNESQIDFISRYAPGEAQSPNAKINYGAFRLLGMPLSAMDNGYDVDFGFNEAFSFVVPCDSQEEIDYLWQRLSHVPEAEQCGWLKDAYGLSWQIVPAAMGEMLANGTPEERARITAAFLKMKKMDIAALEKAKRGDSGEKTEITVQTVVNSGMERVWSCWTGVDHILVWNTASRDWHTPRAENDLRVGGTFSYRMEAKDGSMGFDFGGVYSQVEQERRIAYTLGDGRRVVIEFAAVDGGVSITEVFEAEEINSKDLQRQGWQAILDNFRRYVERSS